MKQVIVGIAVLFTAIWFTRPTPAPAELWDVTLPKKTPEMRAQFVEERWLFDQKLLANPTTGEIPANIRDAEKAFATRQPRLKKVGEDLVRRGPINIGGRTRAVAVDLSDPSGDTMLAGGVTSGLFRTTDRGASWVKVSELSDIHTVTALAQDPNNLNVWYYGTGEALGFQGRWGDGIWKSTDSGLTWAQLEATRSDDPEFVDNAFDIVHRLIVDPATSDVYAAIHRNIYRSQDGGETWDPVLDTQNTSQISVGITEIVVTPDGSRFYAAFSGGASNNRGGVWTSTSGDADSWTKIAGIDSDTTPVDWAIPGSYGRIVLALDGNERLYALYDNGHVNDCSNNSVQNKPEADLFRYEGPGGDWVNLSANLPDETGCSDGNDPMAVQGGYDLAIAVSPINPNLIMVGGTNIYRSTSGFTNTSATRRIGGYARSTNYQLYSNHHPDIHTIVFDPFNPDIVITGSDGGVHEALAEQSIPAWTSLNNEFTTLQYYHVAQKPSALDTQVIGGTQDNGTTYADQGDAHQMILGGDGVSVGIGQTITDRNGSISYYYMGFQRGGLFRLNTRSGFTDIQPNGTNNSIFVTLFQLDQDNPDVLYYADNESLYLTTNATNVSPAGWTQLFGVGQVIGAGDSPSDTNEYPIAEITPSRGVYGPDSKLYLGDFHGRIWRLDDPLNVGISDQPIDITPPGASRAPGSAANGLAVDPYDANVLMATYSNYGVPGIFITEDAGTSWTNIQGNLELPAKFACAIANTGASRQYFVGTTAGLWRATELEGANTVWSLVGDDVIGIPWVRDLDYRPSDGNLLIGTYGNGMYELAVDGLPGTDLAHRLHLPEIRSGGDVETFVTLINDSGLTVDVAIYAFDENGDDLGAAQGLTALDTDAATRFSIGEAFPQQAADIAWLQIGSSAPIRGMAELQSATTRSAYAAETLSESIYLPHIAQNTALFETVTAVINGGASSVNTQLDIPPLNQEFILDGAQEVFGKTAVPITQLLGTDLVNGPALYGIANTQSGAVAGMEYFTRLPQRSQEASLGLNLNSGANLRFLHVATDTAQFWTGMVYINTSSARAAVTENMYDATGNLLTQNSVSLASGEKRTLLFDADNQTLVPAGTAWVEVSSNQNLIGYELVGSPIGSNNDNFAGLQGVYGAGETLTYPFVQPDAAGFTGIVAVNTSSLPSDITFEAISADGQVLESTFVAQVGPKVKLVQLATDLFSDATLNDAVWIRAQGSTPVWAGFQLWGDQGANRQYLSGLNAFQ